MSTPADVVRDLAALVRELAALLETQTAKEIPNIARDLGAQPQLAQGVDALGRVLGEIRAGAVPLRTQWMARSMTSFRSTGARASGSMAEKRLSPPTMSAVAGAPSTLPSINQSS